MAGSTRRRAIYAMAALILTVSSADSAVGQTASQATIMDGTPRTDPRWLAAVERMKSRLSRVHGGVFVVGDSLAAGWPRDLPVSGHPIINLGIGGDTTQNLLWRLRQTDLAGARPAGTVMIIGTNDFRFGGTVDTIVQGIIANVMEVSRQLPGLPIVVIGILPRGRQMNLHGANIAQVNKIVSSQAGKIFDFVDVTEHLREACNNTLPCPLYKDLTHITSDAYPIIAEPSGKFIPVAR